MADFGTFLTWAEPATPATIKRPLSAVNTALPLIQRSRLPSGVDRPLTESQFYGTIKFGVHRSPAKPFNYFPPKKRPLDTSPSDENAPPVRSGGSSPSPADAIGRPAKRSKPNPPIPIITPSTKRKSPWTDAQKIEAILETIQAQNWTLACFLYNIFRTKNAKGDEIHRSQTHSQMVSIFLAGRAKKTVGNII
jgi:hypothetical protein